MAFKKGKDWNGKPGPGRPKIPYSVKKALRELGPNAVEVLREVMANKKHVRREQAAEYVINRLEGMPRATIDANSNVTSAASFVVSYANMPEGCTVPLLVRGPGGQGVQVLPGGELGEEVVGELDDAADSSD